MYASMLRWRFGNPLAILGKPSLYYQYPRLVFCLFQQQVESDGLRFSQEPWSGGMTVRHYGLMSGYRTLTKTRKMMTTIHSSNWTERDYNSLADATLDAIHAEVERALEDGYDGEFDVSLSQGVLTVLINDRGSWVINKQGPNRQIWWSSPLSGPQRYEWRHNEDEWVHTRSDENLLKILRAEMLEVSGVDLNLKAMEIYIKEKRL